MNDGHLQVAISAVILTSHERDDKQHRHHHHYQLGRLVCENGGQVLEVQWSTPSDHQLTTVLDHPEYEQRQSPSHGQSPSADDVQWTLPYVTVATSTTWSTHQSQPIISASLPVYSTRSRRLAHHMLHLLTLIFDLL